MKRLFFLLALVAALACCAGSAEGNLYCDADRPALTWHATPDCAAGDAGGLYLASRWDREEQTGFPNDEEDLSAGYDGRPWFGAHWRCGIVDEDGHALTGMNGVKVTLLNDREVLLELESGQVVTVHR